MSSQVVLVNEQDEQIGLAEKLSAHQQGLLHRAFSVFILRPRQDTYEILLQQRAQHKYHCSGLWTNACCSHPREDELIHDAAARRLKEELGFTVPLEKIGVFTYHASLPNGLIEYEIDHVFVGFYEREAYDIAFNSEEVMACRWVPIKNLRDEIITTPTLFTPWILEAFSFVEKYLRSNKYGA